MPCVLFGHEAFLFEVFMKRFLFIFAFAFSILFFNKTESFALDYYPTINGYDCVAVGWVTDLGQSDINTYWFFVPSDDPFEVTLISRGISWQSGKRLFYSRGSNPTRLSGSFANSPFTATTSAWSFALIETVPPSQYVPEIGFGYTLTHFSLFGLNDTTECIRALSFLVFPGTRPDNYKYSLYVNNVEKDKGDFNGLFNFSKNFKHSDYDIVNGDNIRFVVVPYKDGNYGNAHEISWVARNGILKDNQKPIIDSPFVDVDINIPIDNSTNYNFPVDISPTQVTVYQGTTNAVISSSSSYSQNVDVSKHEEVTNQVIQYIENNNNYFYGDTVEEIVVNNTANNNYVYNYDFSSGDNSGNNPLDTFNSVKGNLGEWSDQVLALIAPLNQSVFKPLFITVVAVVGAIIGFALVAVVFKFVGLFL